jgi:hypothetical protein
VKVILHPGAQQEFLSAQRQYSAASEELGRRFSDEISGLFRRIIARPLGYKQFDPPARPRVARRGWISVCVVYGTTPDVLWIVAVKVKLSVMTKNRYLPQQTLIINEVTRTP